ncbi:MAG: cytochrome c-type biogenesis protein CcmH [Actinomycetota bacterium]|nr:cytochrome c-type biogenesis protein CcmH [Actinomycetota bacterium]
MKHLALGAFLLLLFAAPAVAAPEDTANDVSMEVMSPYCPGVTLHDCPSTEADALRERIRGWAEAGWSKSRIMAELEAEFGPSIRATPGRAKGGMVAWAVPAAVVLLGAIVAAALARAWTTRRSTEPADAGEGAAGIAVNAEDRRRLEAELGMLRSRG